MALFLRNFLFFSLGFICFSVEAQNFVRFHEPTLKFSGSGCPVGSTQATVSPDWTSLSILFEANHLEVAGDFRAHPIFGSPVRDCGIDVLLYVSKGFRARALRIDYRGYSQIASGSSGFLQTRLQYSPLNGGRSVIAPDAVSKMDGPISNPLLITQTISFQKAACGEPLKLRFLSSLKIENYTSIADDLSILSLDSADSSLASGLILRAEWEPCR